MTAEQKLEAIAALVNGIWDNQYLVQVGFLGTDLGENILMIIKGDY
jgi:hypothetical protein